jgi:NADH-quinone oxidoreductase subunit I
MFFEISEKVLRVLKAVKEPRIAVDRVEKNPAHLSPIFRGRHRIFYETCTGCDACRKICPVDAIVMKPLPLKRPNKIPEVNLGICIFCGLCEDVCPTKPKSIVLSGGDYDMLTGGTQKDIDQFWVRVEIPEEWIEQKKREEEEKARKKREMMAKKRAAQAAKAAKPATSAKPTSPAKPTDNSTSQTSKPNTMTAPKTSENGPASPSPEKSATEKNATPDTSETAPQQKKEGDNSGEGVKNDND